MKSKITLFLLLSYVITSCNTDLLPAQKKDIHSVVKQTFDSIAKDVTHDGPIAWLKYMENTPDFFMANDGQLAFPSYDVAQAFIKNELVKKVSKIQLGWTNLHIDPLTPELAMVAANYHEDMTYILGSGVPTDGYFTALAQKTPNGWKLRDLHWSSVAAK